jgi:hypothetical protein
MQVGYFKQPERLTQPRETRDYKPLAEMTKEERYTQLHALEFILGDGITLPPDRLERIRKRIEELRAYKEEVKK